MTATMSVKYICLLHRSRTVWHDHVWISGPPVYWLAPPSWWSSGVVACQSEGFS